METEGVRVYQQGDEQRGRRLTRLQAEAWAARQLGLIDDENEWELHAYAENMQLTADERHFAKQLGLSDETLRQSKTRHLIRDGRR